MISNVSGSGETHAIYTAGQPLKVNLHSVYRNHGKESAATHLHADGEC
jgi:hypothetical protein